MRWLKKVELFFSKTEFCIVFFIYLCKIKCRTMIVSKIIKFLAAKVALIQCFTAVVRECFVFYSCLYFYAIFLFFRKEYPKMQYSVWFLCKTNLAKYPLRNFSCCYLRREKGGRTRTINFAHVCRRVMVRGT